VSVVNICHKIKKFRFIHFTYYSIEILNFLYILVPIDETPGISILYIFVDIQVNIQHIVNTLKHHFTSDSKLALVSTIQFVRTLQVINFLLKYFYLFDLN
jgi:diphthamide biosynthesis enzyme Dph1/Dph2-like protein